MNLNLTKSFVSYLADNLDLNQDQKEIALYGLQSATYAVVDLLLICLGGWLIGYLQTTLIIAISTATLRSFSGGAHSRSPLVCALLGMFVVPLLGWLSASMALSINRTILSILIMAGMAVALLLIWRLAPVDSPAKPITSIKERQKFRNLSLLIVLVTIIGEAYFLIRGQALVIITAISFGFWWQTFSITRLGQTFAKVLDNICLGKGGVHQ